MNLKFEIVKSIAVLGEPTGRGWTKELNLVSWNGWDAKYDLRTWDAEHEKCGKGITLTEDEFLDLVAALGGDKDNFKDKL